MRTAHYRLIVCAFTLLCYGSANVHAGNKDPEKIKLYIWWDYLAPRVIEKMKENDLDFQAYIYRSNDVAITRLIRNTDKFHIAVISNAIAPILYNERLLNTDATGKILASRSYIPFIKKNCYGCVPYLWSSTVYVYTADQSVSPPDTLAKLIALQEKGFHIGIIDDMFEVAARIVADTRPQGWRKKNGGDILNQLNPEDIDLMPVLRGIKSQSFLSSPCEILKQPKSAAYTWHGELNSLAGRFPQKYRQMKISLPEAHPVVGFDLICILNQKDSRIPLERLIRFVELLTDRESTDWNVAFSQYFSPYRNDTDGLNSQMKDLYGQLTRQMMLTQPVTIRIPDPETHRALIDWWQKIRYENNTHQ